MMDYNSLFNLLYSTEISENTKSDIINRMSLPVFEATEETSIVETYLELLDTLVYSSASEALIYNIIDETFANLDEEFINEVSNAWVKRKTEAGLKAREKAYNQARSNVIGLSSLNKASKAYDKLERGQQQVANRTKVTPLNTNPTAMDKLKSAVGKVKNWASGNDRPNLSRIIGYKANKDNAGAETLRKQTTQKVEAPKAEKVNKTAKASKVKSSPDETLKKAKEIGDRIHKQVQADIKKMDKEQAKRDSEAQKETEKRQKKFEELKAQASKKKENVEQPKLEAPKAEEATSKKEENVEQPAAKKTTAKKTKVEKSTKKVSKKNEKPQEVQAEAPESAEEPKIKISMKKTPEQKDTAYQASVRRQMEAARKDQERMLQTYRERRQQMTSKPGYDPATVQDLDKRIADLEKTLNATKVNEALSDLAYLLVHTNISESCFVEVMEMTITKANAEKVKDRYDDEVEASIDALYKDVKEGKPIDPEKVKKADNIAKREEHFEELFRKRFNDSK